MSKALPTLYYIHDPMCSWCWGFRYVWKPLQQTLAGMVTIKYVLGGLAPDTDQLMPENMQQSIRNNWRRIQQEIPVTEFNYDFWTRCQPRRSTYPSCRAIIACKMQNPRLEEEMILAIQQAYYLEAKNPSDEAILIQAAAKLGLDSKRFAVDLNSEQCQLILNRELALTKDLGVYSFPSLVLSQQKTTHIVDIHYTRGEKIYQQIKANIEAFSVR